MVDKLIKPILTALEKEESVYNAQSSLSGMHLNSVDDVYNSQTDAPIYQALNCTSNAEKMMCYRQGRIHELDRQDYLPLTNSGREFLR